ncbi:MAG: hypothetical protein K2X47_07775 [Bdellovibrionales bacterium]|nr:hypothetical protein [Bdellovibrionales bacterium]
MITMNKFHEVCALYRLGKNKTEVARELGISIPTVRKYLQTNIPPSYAPRASPTKVDHFQRFSDFVKGKLELVPKLSAGEIYALIKPQGYLGSERTIQRRL